ncbi:reverse transcriptase/maturase, group FT II introns [Streptococcus varani]|uniref:Reverse transcriptase/maturase, group FT II introns n=2 Tax=Streptococcus varani TaxID=1608583 RepID=A0A0E4H5K7_9STRE|nr:reverse transcriptase/maturase, group FT II introns [Streptococcus varani]
MSTKLRYFEYYNMQYTFDWLYERSKQGCRKGLNLYDHIISENNILLAYRMIKANTGSKTAGVDGQTISEFKLKDKQCFIKEIRKALQNYSPQPVKRVEIPKANGKTRPLGIPTMQDRLIQQMFKQVLEPICEAKFYNHSYGFRPNRSAQDAITRCSFLMNQSTFHYVVDVDIKSFFDNVNHKKLLSQLYTIGIKDRRVLAIIGKMLKAPIDKHGIPTKGTPQGGILSPLLSNVVLNDLDQWISSQWENFPTQYPYKSKWNGLRQLRKHSNLKEMYIVRYADDFKIFAKTYKEAWKIFQAVKGYLNNHLKLEISPEKSKVTNLKRRRSEFLGFELRAIQNKGKYVASTHVSKKNKARIKQTVKEHLKLLQKSPSWQNVKAYNSYILGIHNYYRMATCVNIDFSKIAYSLSFTHFNRLQNVGKYETARHPPPVYRKFYKNNLRTYKIAGLYLYPLADIQWRLKVPMNQEISDYTLQGRMKAYKQLDQSIFNEIQKLQSSENIGFSLEYEDNRISKYSMQKGKCAVSGVFLTAAEVHCHHILPRRLGGGDDFSNLIIVHQWVHKLIHAKDERTIERYKKLLHLTKVQMEKLNKYRETCNLTKIN